jgi:hypothetical protein
MIRRISLLLSVSLLAFSLDGAHASRNAQTFLDVETRPFTEQAAQIRQDLAAGDKYSEIKDSDRRDVMEASTHSAPGQESSCTTTRSASTRS